MSRVDDRKIDTIREYGHYQVTGPTRLRVRVASIQYISSFIHEGFRFCGRRYSVLKKGKMLRQSNPYVRISSNCQWSFYFDNQYCDCRWQLEKAKELLHQEGKGLIIFAHDQHGKSVGIEDHWKIYAEGQRRGLELVVDSYKELGYKEDSREYEDVVEILHHYKIKEFRLLTNSPRRTTFFLGKGFTVQRVGLQQPLHDFLFEEYSAKKHKLGHLLRF